MKFSLSSHLLLLGAAVKYTTGQNENVLRKVHTGRRLQVLDEESCIAVVVEVQYSKDDLDSQESEASLACVMSNGFSYKVPFADDEYIRENFIEGEFTSGQTELILGGNVMFDVDTSEIMVPSAGQTQLRAVNTNRRKLVTTTGVKSLLVVRVIASNKSTTANENQLSDSIFGTNGDQVNLKSQFSACSNGMLTFNPAVGEGILNGVTQVTVRSSTNQGDARMNNEITANLNSAFGVSSPAQIADHIMYCLPKGTMKGIAYAYFNSYLSVFDDDWCTYPSVGLHELGHNLNLRHSGEVGDPYGDQSGMMGYSYAEDENPRMCFNAAKSWKLGWYSDRTRTLDKWNANVYSGELAGITANPGWATGPPMLLKLDVSSGDDFYLSYNNKESFNSGTKAGANEIRIVQDSNSGSTLQASLKVDQSWTSSKVFGGDSVIVSRYSGPDPSSAYVYVCIGACDQIDPPVSPPVPAPSPKSPAPSNCVDSQLKFLVNKRLRSCNWVKQNNTANRCSKNGGFAATHCPVACGQTVPRGCIDATKRFALQENGALKSCAWVAKTSTQKRCRISGVADTCPVTCKDF
mmetsp:Transcript_26449/g.39122  ORF Transcript_26449/g.39122 Transcript_26449/m.39122 type:complete len:577 (+) Transcript_26449:78-1808(+)